jgi:hypothetical protein
MQVIYPAHVIAAAAFYFARKFTHTHIEKGPDGREWWEQYGVRIEDLRGTPHATPPVAEDIVDVDVVLAMVDVYNSLPHLGYEGKYPPAIISPQISERGIPVRNGSATAATGDGKGSEGTERKTGLENGMMKKENIPDYQREDQEMSSPPPPPPPLPAAQESSRQPPRERSVNIPPPERGRSPTRRLHPINNNNNKESHGPHSPSWRNYSCSRSPSRGRSSERGSARHIDQYISPERRKLQQGDTYIPPLQQGRKRSFDEGEETTGRDKRQRSFSSEGEISEGEVR